MRMIIHDEILIKESRARRLMSVVIFHPMHPGAPIESVGFGWGGHTHPHSERPLRLSSTFFPDYTNLVVIAAIRSNRS